MKKTTLLIIVAVLLLTFIFLSGCESVQEITEEFYRDKVVVLMYHHVDWEFDSRVTITPAKFEEHLDTLLNKGYNVISLTEFRDFLRGEIEVPSNAVLITFDDGYESFYTYAYPLLKERGLSATNFMVVAQIGDRTHGSIPKLDWSQMKRMIGSSMYFPSHSYDSHLYAYIDPEGNWEKPVLVAPIYLVGEGRIETYEEYRTRIYEDLRRSRELLEQELGVGVYFFSVPYGWKNEKVSEAAKEAGFEYIFTIQPGLVSMASDPMGLPRINAGSPDIDGSKLHRIILETVENEGGS